nr:Extracellular serine protease [Chlamydiota bacterium]
KLTLTSTLNSYFGTTTCAGGILSISAITNLGNSSGLNFTGGALEIAGNLTLTQPITLPSTGNILVASGNTAIFSGAMSGAAGIDKQSSGTLEIAGAPKTYLGGTTISDGTLKIGVADVLPSSTAVTISANGILDLNNLMLTIEAANGSGNVSIGSGNLVIDSASSSALSGVISGSGDLMNQGGSALTLTGSNTFSGLMTNAIASTLEGSNSSLSSNISNAGSLIFNQPDEGIYSRAFTGSGTMRKEGTGKLTLTGTNAQSATTVAAGELNVNGTLTGSLLVENGTTLSGEGTVGNVTLNGTIAPGNSIGTMFVADFTFSSGSTFEVEIDPTSSDLISASGIVTIDPGATINVTSLPGIFPATNTYTLITASALVGTFDTEIFFPQRFLFSLIYSSTELQLFVKSSTFESLVSGFNVKAVAQCFDVMDFSSDPDLQNIVLALDACDPKALEKNFNQMQPALYNAIALAEENNLIAARLSISERLLEYRKSYYDPCCCESYTAWIAPFGVLGRQKTRSGQLGFRTNEYGVMLGLDRVFCEYSFIGGAVGYSNFDIDWSKSKSEADVDAVQVALYGRLASYCWYFDAIALGAKNYVSTERAIKFVSSEFNSKRIAKGNHDSKEFDLYGRGGAIFYLCSIDVNPFASIEYLYIRQDGFRESGAKSLNLKVKDKTYNMLRIETGIELSKYICTEYLNRTIKAGIKYGREERYKGKETKSEFIAGQCSFVVRGLNPSRSLLIPSIGVLIETCDGKYSFSGYYETQLGYRKGKFGKDYINHNLNIRLGYTF